MKKSIKSLLLATSLMGLVPLKSMAGVFISVSFGPPVLPVYEQPVCPAPGYLWTPGYWAFADGAYYWVPGTWVVAPEPGLLWTPGYWAFESAAYFWHPGYWGPTVGFYGGVNYGYGYSGVGYQGGYWNHNQFNYNRTVNNIHVTNVTNVYNTYNAPVINNNPGSHVAYNGGPGGIRMQPNAREQQAMREQHYQWTRGQQDNEHWARSEPIQRVSYNNGHPGVFATPTPGAGRGPGAVTHGRAEPASEMPRGVPHAPPVAYDQGGRNQPERNQPERNQAVQEPQQRAPQYHYTQQAPQSDRQPKQVQAERSVQAAEQQRAPQYRYTQQAPQPYRQPQPVQPEHVTANGFGERAQPAPRERAPGNQGGGQLSVQKQEAPRYTYRENAPQAYYPPTMAQRNQAPAYSGNRQSTPGEYRQTSQAPQRHEAEAPNAQAQSRKPDASHQNQQWRSE